MRLFEEPCSGAIANPWKTLSVSAPFTAGEDLATTEAFDRGASEVHRLRFDLVPEPYLGNPRAPVVLLNGNPGYPADGIVPDFGPRFERAAMANLSHAHPDWPFYLLDPRLPSIGGDWWRRRLRALADAVGGYESVAQHVFVAETHGYHSIRYKPISLPSQQYTRRLVLQAIDRNAVVIIMRSKRVWLELVPELQQACVFSLRNVQNVTVSPGNCPAGFRAAVAAILRAKGADMPE